MILRSAQPPGPPAAHHPWRRGWVPAILVATALSVTACSSATASSPNPTSARSDVQRLYRTFFSLSNKSIPTKLALVQDGSNFKSAEIAAIKFGSSFIAPGSPSAPARGATVQSVKLLSDSACKKAIGSAPCAEVHYSIVATDGAELLSNLRGYAVYLSGHWLVSKTTLCGLFSLIDLSHEVPDCAN